MILYRFLVDAAEIIRKNSMAEGIFRKSGSINRQKELKVWLNLIFFLLYHKNGSWKKTIFYWENYIESLLANFE